MTKHLMTHSWLRIYCLVSLIHWSADDTEHGKAECQLQIIKLMTRSVSGAVTRQWTDLDRFETLSWMTARNLLKIYAQFPPMRKWMEVLPVHNQHPSCRHPLSGRVSEGIALDIRQLLLLHPWQVNPHFSLCGSEGTRNRRPPPFFFKRPNVWPCPAFVILF